MHAIEWQSYVNQVVFSLRSRVSRTMRPRAFLRTPSPPSETDVRGARESALDACEVTFPVLTGGEGSRAVLYVGMTSIA